MVMRRLLKKVRMWDAACVVAIDDCDVGELTGRSKLIGFQVLSCNQRFAFGLDDRMVGQRGVQRRLMCTFLSYLLTLTSCFLIAPCGKNLLDAGLEACRELSS